MTIGATPRKRDKLAAQLTWLANRDILNLPEDRRHDRIVPRNPIAVLTLEDGTKMTCRIIDLSLSGAAIAAENRPPLKSTVFLGRVQGRVVRNLEDGFALEFMSEEVLQQATPGLIPGSGTARAAKATRLSPSFISWLQAGPMMLVFLAFFLIPLVFVVIVSFWDYNEYQLLPAFSGRGYTDTFEGCIAQLPDLCTIGKTYLKTLKLCFLVWAITLFIGFWVAYFLAFHVKSKTWQMGLSLLCTIPFWTSNVIRMVRDGSAQPASPTILAGTPATVTLCGTGLTTTEPAAMRAQWPISMLPRIFAPAPINTP